jgi:hypothetical protein
MSVAAQWFDSCKLFFLSLLSLGGQGNRNEMKPISEHLTKKNESSGNNKSW